MSHLPSDMIDRLKELGLRLIDQRNARILVPALGNESGFWFGGGNLLQEPNGTILACGRFRNPGMPGREPVRENAAWSSRSSAEPPRMLNSQKTLVLSPRTISP